MPKYPSATNHTPLQASPLGSSAEYVESQFEAFQSAPDSLGRDWQNYFSSLPASVRPESRMSQVRAAVRRASRRERMAAGGDVEHDKCQAKITQLINAFRLRGHERADIDPLGIRVKPEVREIDASLYGFSDEELRGFFDTSEVFGTQRASLKDVIAQLQKIYCGSIGVEFMHILDTTQKNWIQRQIEAVGGKPQLSLERKNWILNQLTAAEGLERFLHTRYTGQKRFSLEGSESLIVILNSLIEQAGADSVNEVVMAMAHRGRLNVLVNVLGKNPADLFSEFEGQSHSGLIAGDVKYHQGFSSDIATASGSLHLALAFNPSHLEIVGATAEGSVRARQDRRNDANGEEVVPIIIHGDAAFAGQGVVMETLNMSKARGFSTHGTIHVIVNNQIGFTTSNPLDARSTPYCTDVAKMTELPIFHVNGDDPEAVYFVSQLAFKFRQNFGKDVVIDLVSYRRHGHNEADEPAATQPRMYGAIKKLSTTRARYAEWLQTTGILRSSDADQLMQSYRKKLGQGECVAANVIEQGKARDSRHAVDWKPYLDQDDSEVDTSVPADKLRWLGERMTHWEAPLRPHPRVAKIYQLRRQMTAGEVSMDWGYAETLAYATLLHDGKAIRISGQDSCRGTFFHRHAALHDMEGRVVHIPLQHLFADQPNFTIIDSLLSEEAVLGFEYGYATASPETLTIWEAQFGDFANGAQIVIDQFISSGEVKWGRLCGLVLYLPHGYEGQGPEHSSARLERFLQLCANENMQIIAPTTPAQVFHMIRRQMLKRMRRPLIVMTGKSLLRNPLSSSSLEELSGGQFLTVIDDLRASLKSEEVRRIVCCTGKVCYDLDSRMREKKMDAVAVVRIEQLYPFPYQALAKILRRYPAARELVWCQEEPKNQGAWRSIRHRIERLLSSEQKLSYRGRHSSASPAVGYASIHQREQAYVVDCALGLEQWSEPNRPGIT